MSQFRKQKKYIQKYRTKWEHMDEFRGWLKPLPKDITKAYCSICNVIIKAHLCDLRKHGASKKHINAAKLVRTLKTLNGEQGADFDTELPLMENDNNDFSEEEDEIGTEDESVSFRWTQEAVGSLVKHLKTYWKDFRDGHRKKKDIWEDVSAAMVADGFNINSYECGKKFRNIKLRYFSVLEKIMVGETPNIRIEYFEELNALLAKDPETLAYIEQKKLNHKVETVVGEYSEEDTVMIGENGYDIITDGDMEWTESSTHLMLDFLLEFKDFFSGKEGESDEAVWQLIAEQMRLQEIQVDEVQCRRKWQNLVEQFNHYKAIAESTGTLPLWPYFTRVRHVINTVQIPTQNLVEKKPLRIRLKSSNRNRRKRKLSEQSAESEGSGAEEESLPKRKPIKSSNSSENSACGGEGTVRQMRRLAETAALWQRLNAVEMRLDELSDQQEIQRHTNSLLSQILSELSTLANHISPRGTSQSDSVQVQDGITIVVPNSEH